MTRKKVRAEADIFVKSLCMMYSVKWLREAAERTGFIKRERKISPEIFFLGFSVGIWSFFCRGH